MQQIELPAGSETQAVAELSVPVLDGLMLQVGMGNQQAFAQLYDRTVSRVFGMTMRLLRSPSDAEEVTQDVYLEVWLHATIFDATKGSAIGWMLTLTHFRTVDKIRRVQAARNRDAVYVAETVGRDEDSVSADVLQIADTEQISSALNGLSKYRREALMYAYFSDHTYQQASEILQIPLGTFKSRVRDGVLALRSAIAGAQLQQARSSSPGSVGNLPTLRDPRAQ